MITIKKYPNRRMYNTHTSKYINLAGIQSLIEAGEDVQILDSKSNLDVTTQTLLLHVFDAETLELLVPSMTMQTLMRLSTEERQQVILQDAGLTPEPESETQHEERTQPSIQLAESVTHPKVDISTPTSVEDNLEHVSESTESSKDSDSEVTVVRVDAPPTVPQPLEDSVESSAQGTIDVETVAEQSNEPSTPETPNVETVGNGIPSFWGSGEAPKEWVSEESSEESSSQSEYSSDSASIEEQGWSVTVHPAPSEDLSENVRLEQGNEEDEVNPVVSDREQRSVTAIPSFHSPTLESKADESDLDADRVEASTPERAPKGTVTQQYDGQNSTVREDNLETLVDDGSAAQLHDDRTDSSSFATLPATANEPAVESAPSVTAQTTEPTEQTPDGRDEVEEPMSSRAAQMKARLEQMKARLRR